MSVGLDPHFGKPYVVGQVAVDPVPLEYSDIVDRSDFRFPDEDAKISRLSEQDTGTFEGQYDYNDGEVPSDPNNDPVSMFLVNLRQGKYSKGEIEDIKRAMERSAVEESKSISSSKKSKAKSDLQDKIDAAISSSLEKSEQDVTNGK